MTAQPLPATALIWPQALPTPLPRFLVLALLLHVWLVLMLGNAPGGTAREGQGVFGSLNITLQGAPVGPVGQAQAPQLPATPTGAPGDAQEQRFGGAVRSTLPQEATPPGAAQLGNWAPLPAGRPDGQTAAAALEPALPLPLPLLVPAPPVPVPVPVPVTAPAPAPAPVPPPMAAVTPMVQSTPVGPGSQGSQGAAAVQREQPADADALSTTSTLGLKPIAPATALATPDLAPLRQPPASLAALPAVPLAPVTALASPLKQVPALPAKPVAPALTEPALRANATLLPEPPPVLASVPAPSARIAPAPAALPEPVLMARPATVLGAAVSGPQPALPTTSAAAAPVAAAALPSLPKPGPLLPALATGAGPGAPDAGSRLGNDVATLPSTPASAPKRLNLELPRLRGGELSRYSTTGLLPALPRPPEVPDKLGSAIEKAAKEDCRKAYAGAGLLAVVPLAVDALREGGCKW